MAIGTAVCPTCGKPFSIDSSMVGQSVACPWCGEEIYMEGVDAPLETGVPVGILHNSVASGKTTECTPPNLFAFNAHRPSVARTNVAIDNMDSANSQRSLWQILRIIIALLTVLGVFAGGCWVVQAQHKAKVVREETRHRAIEREQEERERAEEERRLRERAEEERRQLERAEEEKKRREEDEAREAAEKAREADTARYAAAFKAFVNAKLRLMGPQMTNDLATTALELLWFLPSEKRHPTLYHDIREVNGTRRVWGIEEDGAKTELDPVLFDARTKALDCFAMKGDVAYFNSSRGRANTYSGVLDKRANGNPADVFFGAMSGMVRRLGPKFPELTFDILFKTSEDNTKIFVENIAFGDSYSLQKVRAAIEGRYPLGKSRNIGSKAKYKRTVKSYGGNLIKTGMDGITYVPMAAPDKQRMQSWAAYRRACDRWRSLKDRADREDEEERAFNERQDNVLREQRQSGEAQRYDQWQKKIDRIFDSGTLYFVIKGRKVE